MAVLITGAAGYVGSHTTYALSKAGYDLVAVDNLSTGFREALPANIRFYQGDIRDKFFLERLFTSVKIDGVIHFAAFSQVAESMREPLKYYDNNVYGTSVLLSCMLAHNVKRIVFSSTAAVYGEPTQIPIEESAPVHPTNCYGETKYAMERMMEWAAKAHGLQYVALRYFNACGAHPDAIIGEAHQPETHLIPLVLQAASGIRSGVSIFGDDYATPDGSCVRDYIHVCDLAQAHILALNYLMQGGQSAVFNLGSGRGYSVKEIISAAQQISGCNFPVSIQGRRDGDPAILVASSRKATEALGWQLRYSDLTTILTTAWKWHKTHPHGYA